MKWIEGNVVVTFYEGQRLMSVLQQLYLCDISLHQQMRVHSHLRACGAQVFAFVISVKNYKCKYKCAIHLYEQIKMETTLTSSFCSAPGNVKLQFQQHKSQYEQRHLKESNV